ncbi:MAG: TatD family hydrolase [Blastocatellia bacterium]
MELIDIGVNLGHRSFDRDRDAVIERAGNTGVRRMIVTGTSLDSSRTAAELAAMRPGTLYSTAGVHPHNAGRTSLNSLSTTLRTLAGLKEVVAIGECGLDFNRDFSARPDQEKVFEAQLELACELKKPIFLHERDAHSRFVQMLKSHRGDLVQCVVHCFTGNEDELRTYLDFGCHIGITGWIADTRRGLHLRELVRLIPGDRLMLETDAPFLLPRNLKRAVASGRNEPAFLRHVLTAVAECRSEDEEAVARITTDTATEFFQLS